MLINTPPKSEVRTAEITASQAAAPLTAETDGPETTGAPGDDSAASQYCNNIVDAAIDARITWQRQNLAEAEKELAKRTAELQAKTAEFQRWLTRRDEFAEKAKKQVVDIYTKMKPDAAALQLQALDEETAAAVVIKLDPRAASAVMNEMDPIHAARLTAIISGAGKLPSKPKAPGSQGNRS
jgi:flagellar motility protein MotE (MotC chaperone)